MRIHLVHEYEVRIHPRPIIRDGEPCRAWCDYGRRLILISEQVPRDGRDLVLRHEAWHAWAHDRGLPPDPDAELLADEVARFSLAIEGACNAAGGAAAIRALGVAPELARSAHGVVTLSDRAECPRCGAAVMAGSIATTPAEWAPALGVWRVGRGMACGACDAVTTWSEQALADGTPTGEILPHPPPRMLRGAEAAAWLSAHGELVGVLCR